MVPVTPEPSTVKSVASTPDTVSLNVTVKLTLVALAAGLPDTAMLLTLGAVRSTVCVEPDEYAETYPFVPFPLPDASVIFVLLFRSRRIDPVPVIEPTVML